MAETPWYLDAANLALSLYGSMESADAAEDAAKQQAFGTLLANRQQQKQMADLRRDAAPIREFRDANLAELSRLNDLQAGPTGFMASPEYQAAYGAAAGVTPDSGAPASLGAALQDRAQNIGLGEYGNYYNRRNQYTNLGSDALNSLNSAMQQNSATQQGLAQQYGAELGSGKVASANAATQGITGLLSLAGNIFGGSSGSSGGDTLGGGFGGFLGGDGMGGSGTMHSGNGTFYLDNILGGEYFTPQDNTFSLSNLFSGGGQDGQGNLGYLGDFGGGISSLFNSGLEKAQSLSLSDLGNYAKTGLTAVGSNMLGNLAGGTVSELLGGGAGGQFAGNIASQYAKPLGSAAMNYLDTGAFNYSMPDFGTVATNAVGGLVGGALGGLVADKIGGAGGQLAGMGTQYAFNQYAMPYLTNAASSLLGGSTAAGTTAATTAGTTAATTAGTTAGTTAAGTTAGSSSSGGLGLGVAAIPVAMVLGSLANSKAERQMESDRRGQAEFDLLQAGLRYDPKTGQAFIPDNISTSRLAALMDPGNVAKLTQTQIMAGVGGKDVARPYGLSQGLQSMSQDLADINAGTYIPHAQRGATDPMAAALYGNLYNNFLGGIDVAGQAQQGINQALQGYNPNAANYDPAASRIVNLISQRGLLGQNEQNLLLNGMA